MTNTAESLRVLGLSPRATLEDANQAYKDLVRVWHPDRFQSDQKLKLKAEDNTRKINEAVSHLRTIFKKMPAGSNLEALERSSTNTRPSSTPTSSQTRRDARVPDDHDEEESQPLFANSFRADRIMLPKRFYQTGTFAILRILKGGISLGFAYLSYSYIEATPPFHLMAAIFLASRGVSGILRNSTLFLLHRPIAIVSPSSLHILEFGSISLRHISEIRVTGDIGRYKIRVTLWQGFLEQVPFEYRLILKTRHFFKGSHFVLKGRGLDDDPTLIVGAFRYAITIPSTRPATDKLLHLRQLAWSQIIAFASVITCATRCFLDGDIILEIAAPYVVIFLMCRLYSLILGIAPHPKATNG